MKNLILLVLLLSISANADYMKESMYGVCDNQKYYSTLAGCGEGCVEREVGYNCAFNEYSNGSMTINATKKAASDQAIADAATTKAAKIADRASKKADLSSITDLKVKAALELLFDEVFQGE